MTATTAGHRPRSHRAAALLFGMVFGAALIAVPAAPSAAHDALVSSTPASGETVTASPPSVALTFSAEILADTPSAIIVEVTDPAGTVVSEGDAAVDGATVTQAVTAGLPDGDYTVTWRVVSSDGHPISSDLHFFVASEGTAADADSGGVGVPEDATASTPSSDGTAGPSPDRSTGADASDARERTDGEAALLPLLLVTALVVLSGILVVVALRVRQTRRSRDEAGSIRHTEDDTSIEGPS